MNNEPKPIIICENLVKIFQVADLEIVALQGLELSVARGEILGVVGTSGSGKSTLLNILGGLDRPSAGKVSVDGVDLLSMNENMLTQYQREKVGFVWQQTSRNLIPYLTAQENIEFPMTITWSRNKKEKREWSSELLNAVGLYQRRHHLPRQMSGGEQQRVAIAVALANRPVLLLGDEPTGEVDSVTAQMIMGTFHKLNEMMGLTTIIVTHDPRIAGQVERVVAIRDGKTSTETIRQVSQLERAMAGERPANIEYSAETQEVSLQEFVVLDSAGRLQIPRDILEKLGIGKRAQLEAEQDRIIIKPVAGEENTRRPGALSLEEQLAALFAEEPPVPRKKMFRRRGKLGQDRQERT